MSNLSDIGNLMYLYLENIDPGKGIDIPDFLIQAAAGILSKNGGHNWVPVIVKETTEDQYQVIGNYFIYAVAKFAQLERVWCIIAESSQEAEEITQVLARETIPKINLSTASRDEIQSALRYLIEEGDKPLKGVNLAVATNKIDESDRQFWKNFEPITKLKCGITKGKKLDSLKQVFCLTPKSEPERSIIAEPKSTDFSSLNDLNKLTLKALKDLAKQKGLTGYSSLKKAALIKLLS